MPTLRQLDQTRLQQHADVEMEMTGVDTESLGELTVRQLLLGAGTEHLEDAQAKRMPERL